MRGIHFGGKSGTVPGGGENAGLFRDRGREFKIRVEGFVQDDSPWYLGKGPFQENENFHPLLLSEQEFPVYIRAIAEMVA